MLIWDVIAIAPWPVLYGMGFRKWSHMNELIQENIDAKPSKKINIPIINSDGDKMQITGGKRRDVPTLLLNHDRDVIMFPGEWYHSIPDGFLVTSLYGEQYEFKKKEADDDIRYGCLPYGFQRPCVKKQTEPGGGEIS